MWGQQSHLSVPVCPEHKDAVISFCACELEASISTEAVLWRNAPTYRPIKISQDFILFMSRLTGIVEYVYVFFVAHRV